MFNLYVDLIVYSMALKSPDGELSLEVVIVIVILSLPFTSLPFSSLLLSSPLFSSLLFSSLLFSSLLFSSLLFSSLLFSSLLFSSLLYSTQLFPSLPFPSLSFLSFPFLSFPFPSILFLSFPIPSLFASLFFGKRFSRLNISHFSMFVPSLPVSKLCQGSRNGMSSRKLFLQLQLCHLLRYVHYSVKVIMSFTVLVVSIYPNFKNI